VANLKDILPLILAGGAGAASPQGADVFNNILRQKRIGEQQDAVNKDREERLTLAKLAFDRADRSETRAVKNQEGVTSLRQMRMEDIERQRERLEKIKKSEQKSVDFMLAENPDVTQSGLVDNTMTLQDVTNVIKSYDPEAPTMEDHFDFLAEAQKRNLAASVDTGQGRLSTGQTTTKAAAEEPEFNETMAEEIFLDAQAGIQKAEDAHSKVQQEYDTLMAAVEQGDEVSSAEVEEVSSRLARKSQAIRDARRRIPLGFAKAGATQTQIDKLMSGAEEQQTVAPTLADVIDPVVSGFYKKQHGGDRPPAPAQTPTPSR